MINTTNTWISLLSTAQLLMNSVAHQIISEQAQCHLLLAGGEAGGWQYNRQTQKQSTDHMAMATAKQSSSSIRAPRVRSSQVKSGSLSAKISSMRVSMSECELGARSMQGE